MSKKVAFASVLCLILGGVALPGGFVVNNVITDMTYNSVDEALLGIKAQAIPLIEPMIKEAGVGETLKQIRQFSLPYIEEIVNASFLTQVLSNAYVIANNTYGEVWGGGSLLNMFFDYYSYNLGAFGGGWTDFSQQLQANGIPPIKSISHWYGENLEIGWGNLGVIFAPEPWPNPYIAWGNGSSTPGFIQDPEVGWGVLEFLADVEEADGNPELQDAMLARYNYTWDPVNYQQLLLFSDEWWKFKAVYDYYYEYWVPEAIPMIINEFKDNTSVLYSMMPEFYNMDTKDIAYYYFLEQWAECSMFEGGVDFHTVEPSIPEGTYGLEVNRPNPSGIPVEARYALWDENNEYSFLDMMTGVPLWLDAYTNSASRQILLDEFDDYGLTLTQLYMLLNWLWGPNGFSKNLIEPLIESEAGYGMSMEEFCFQLLLSQWANGTILGEEMFPGGFPLPLGSQTKTGFEVGVPEPTNMSMESALALWDTSSAYSLVSKPGIAKWLAAVGGDQNTRDQLQTMNGLTDHAMNRLLTWLPKFQHDLMPYLAQYQYSLPTDSITLGNIIQIGGIGLGGSLIGIAAIGLTGNIVAKRRKVSKSKVTSKKAIGKITNTPPLGESSQDVKSDEKNPLNGRE